MNQATQLQQEERQVVEETNPKREKIHNFALISSPF